MIGKRFNVTGSFYASLKDIDPNKLCNFLLSHMGDHYKLVYTSTSPDGREQIISLKQYDNNSHIGKHMHGYALHLSQNNHSEVFYSINGSDEHSVEKIGETLSSFGDSGSIE